MLRSGRTGLCRGLRTAARGQDLFDPGTFSKSILFLCIRFILVIDRKDDAINLCEIKYYNREFEIDAAGAAALEQKRDLFIEETRTRKAVYLTLITANGLKHNAYSNLIHSELTLDDLFT